MNTICINKQSWAGKKIFWNSLILSSVRNKTMSQPELKQLRVMELSGESLQSSKCGWNLLKWTERGTLTWAPNIWAIQLIAIVKIQKPNSWCHYRTQQMSSDGVKFIFCDSCGSVPTLMPVQSIRLHWTRVMVHVSTVISRVGSSIPSGK